MTTLLDDLRYAVRQLRRSSGFSATAILTLALGIGATTAIFTLVYQILLRSIPVSHPEQIYKIGKTIECCDDGSMQGDWRIFSYDLYQQIRDNTTRRSWRRRRCCRRGQRKRAHRAPAGISAARCPFRLRKLLLLSWCTRLCRPPASPRGRPRRSCPGGRPQPHHLATEVSQRPATRRFHAPPHGPSRHWSSASPLQDFWANATSRIPRVSGCRSRRNP